MDAGAVPIGLSILSLIISILTYIQNSEPAQNRRLRNNSMRSIAVRAAIAFEFWQTAAFVEENSGEFPAQQFFAAKENNIRLEEDISIALSQGLSSTIFSDREHSMLLGSLALSTLSEAGHAKDALQLKEELIKKHYLFAILRILEQCYFFNKSYIPKSIRNEYYKIIKKFSGEHWNYLEKNY